MLVKYISMIYLLTSPHLNCSLSIKKDIQFAKQFLAYYGIPEVDPCTKDRDTLCPDDPAHVCSARLVRKKMEFKEFNNICVMDLDNICIYQDSIWTIKHSGPCKMNDNLRRFAKEIEETADLYTSTETTDNKNGTTMHDETVDTTHANNETTIGETDIDATNANDETTIGESETEDATNANDETAIEETENEDATLSELESTTYDDVTEDTTTDITAAPEVTTIANDQQMPVGGMVNDEFNFGKDEIGKIFFANGSVKSALREGEKNTRFPPMRGVTIWDRRIKCEKRVKPCPNMYYPVCLFNHKEEPNNITYYYFINLCEAQQYSCYHPERQIQGSSSVRTGFCAHIQYINYARYVHTMSAWNHYGWLHGPGRYNHILKPHERA